MKSASLIIKRSIKSAASVARARIGFSRPAPDSISVFAYHRVVADIAKAERDAIYGIVISTDTFRRHCEMLQAAYNVVSLETALHFLTGERKTTRPVAVITFDDGYLDFYEQAFPVLTDLRLPATVFLPTDYIGQDRPLAHDRIYWLVKLAMDNSIPIMGPLQKAGISSEFANEITALRNLLKITDSLVYLQCDLREKVIVELENELGPKFEDYPIEYRLLNWQMVREMARKGISFGSHTGNHVVLPMEDHAVMKAEIYSSKKRLEAELGVTVTSFAYPNGEHNEKIRSLTAQAGYEIAVTTENRINRPGTDLLSLGRTSLCEESTRGITGLYSPRVAHLRLGV